MVRITRPTLLEIKKIFEAYGYSELEYQEGKYIVFLLATSMYPAVEIVPLSEKSLKDIDLIRKKYGEIGYAVRVYVLNTLEELDMYLFNLFFQVEISNSRINGMYKTYTDNVMLAYAPNRENMASMHYSFIEIPYTREENFGVEERPRISVVSSIKQDLEKQGAQFIIVEAGAGFGKTSTAYELLHTYADIKKDIRPFFMRLERDRNVSVFKYLLLSQIDEDFRVKLGSDIVIRNIKKGYIPLIIDGFDELLSKDMDNGSMVVSSEKVETMLSTLADLLTDQTKIVLTTRKTAIFSGEQFYDWYYKTLQNGHEDFELVRYQLETPKIENWLSKERREKLPSSFENMSNPVILGYLRYVDDDTFSKILTETSLTEHYFTSILKREIKRQDLPFKTTEQIEILRKLAALFAGLETSVLPRGEVKDAIMEMCYNLLSENATSLKDIQTLANALTNHAFLDRKNENKVGFINDFVFGMFMAYSLMYDTESLILDYHKEMTYPFIDKVIIAGGVCNQSQKLQIAEHVEKLPATNDILRFWVDTVLRGELSRDYAEVSFDGRTIRNVQFVGNYKLTNCTFSNMSFVDCIFDFNQVQMCLFVNCNFVHCMKEGDANQCEFYSCQQDSDIYPEIDYNASDQQLDSSEYKVDNVIKLLEKYFQVDGKTPRMRMVSKLRENYDAKEFKRVFAYMIKCNYIVTNGDKSFIQQQGIEYFHSHK